LKKIKDLFLNAVYGQLYACLLYKEKLFAQH